MSGIVKPKHKAMKSKAVKAALVDGLLSDSATHIHMLLQSQDQQLMSDTMQQLAHNPKSIDTFLRVLADLVAKHPQSAERALRWLNRLIESHSGYIASSPELAGRLGRLRAQLQTRLASLQRLLMLKGRLDLLLSLQARSAAGGGGADVGGVGHQQPAAVHQDSDSDSEVTEGEDEEGEGDSDGEEAEGPDDLAGQLLGNDNASGSEAEMMESDTGISDEDGDEAEEDDGSNEEEEDNDDDDEDADSNDDDELSDDEAESAAGVVR